MSIDTHDLIDYQNEKQEQCTYEYITRNRKDVWNTSAIFGHVVITSFQATGHPNNVDFFVWFKPRQQEHYNLIKDYVKSKGRAITIARNHYRKTYKQTLPA